MLLPSKPAPSFDRSFLIELGGGNAFRQAERTDRIDRSGVRSEFDTPRAQGAPSGSSWRNRRSRLVAPRGQRRLGATG